MVSLLPLAVSTSSPFIQVVDPHLNYLGDPITGVGTPNFNAILTAAGL